MESGYSHQVTGRRLLTMYSLRTVWEYGHSPSLLHHWVTRECWMKPTCKEVRGLQNSFLSQSIIMLNAKVYVNLILPNPLQVFCVSWNFSNWGMTLHSHAQSSWLTQINIFPHWANIHRLNTFFILATIRTAVVIFRCHTTYHLCCFVYTGYVSGPTEFFDCDVDVKPDNPNYVLSSLARSWRIWRHGHVGIAMHNADSGPNNEPTHPFAGRMSYPTINGKHTITGRQLFHIYWM